MSSNIDTPYQIIKNYIQNNPLLTEKLISINETINLNNKNLNLIINKINSLDEVEDIMKLKIKKSYFDA